MRKKIFYPLIAFIGIFCGHTVYYIWEGITTAKQWAYVEDINWLNVYFERQDYFLGLSYGLAVAFTIYAFLKFLESRKSGMAISGITLTGGLYVGICFLLGCCGSPLFAVYLSLFGASFLGVTKPLIFIVTIISILIGYVLIEKKYISKHCCTETAKSK